MPIGDLASSSIDKLGGIPGANIPGSLIQNVDAIRKRFVNVNKDPTSSGNGVTDYDDPTYLGFSFVFNILSPLFNGATSGSAGATSASGVEGNSVEGGQSAIGYLKSIGETNRANYLMAFIQGIREINTSRPYYFQSIEGLDGAWTSGSAMGPDPFVGSKEGEGIAVGCLEAIDLKLTALFSLYRLAVYDSKYRRHILPQNLRYFDVDVRVSEVRNFKQTINYLAALSGGKTSNKSAVDVVGANVSAVTFKFKECEWMAEESGKVFDSVGNGENTVATTSMKWAYGNVWLDGEFAGFNSALLETRNQNAGDSSVGSVLTDFAKDAGKEVAQQVLDSAAKAAAGAVTSAAQKLLFGNVHGGIQNGIANVLQNPGGAIVNATIGGIGSGNAASDPSVNIRIDHNVLGEPGPQPKSLISTSVFSSIPPGPKPLNPDNVHG